MTEHHPSAEHDPSAEHENLPQDQNLPEGERRPDRTEEPEQAGGLGEQIAASYARSGNLRRTADGRIDVLHAIGGVRGLVEAVLPSFVFLVAFLVTESLTPALVLAVGLAVLAALVRVFQRGNLVQALTGVLGVAFCAVFARVGGHAIDYYVPGFWINAAYGAAVALSMAVRWPLAGLLFGFLRGEDLDWRQRPLRRKAYQGATGILLGVFLARLLVQLPLYFAGNVVGLGIARLAMGVPFYALALWLAWLISRPAGVEEDAPLRDPGTGR